MPFLTAPQLFFEPMNFVQNLRYLGTGMAVIFVIIAAIILATTLISRLFREEKTP